eukprot:504897-Prorocentrum_minimum.AAC.1
MFCRPLRVSPSCDPSAGPCANAGGKGGRQVGVRPRLSGVQEVDPDADVVAPLRRQTEGAITGAPRQQIEMVVISDS